MNKNYPRQYEIWLAKLDPSMGSEPGKIRPVVILQSDLLNQLGHTSFVVCAISSQPREGISLLRLQIEPTPANGLLKTSYILCDQIRSIDQVRLMGRLGNLQKDAINRLTESVKAILTL